MGIFKKKVLQKSDVYKLKEMMKTTNTILSTCKKMYCDVLISQKPIPVTYSSTEFSVLQWTSDMHVIGLCLFLKKQLNDNDK